MSTTNEEDAYHGAPDTSARRALPNKPRAAASAFGDNPADIIPKIMSDPALTPEERTVFLMRYMNSREEATERTVRARMNQMQNAMTQAEKQDAMLHGAMGTYSQHGSYNMSYPPVYHGNAYPQMSPYTMQQYPQPSPWSAQGLSDSILAPITTTFSMIQFMLRAFVVIFSWTIIFYIARFFYRIVF